MRTIHVKDRMQRGYSYELVAAEGEEFGEGFEPELTPKEMLALGVFGGKYMTDCRASSRRTGSTERSCRPSARPDAQLLRVDASQPLSVWREKGWIFADDPRGWFQWYCRYYLGRRIEAEDKRQIGRWRAMRRHIGQIRQNCERGDIFCRPQATPGAAALGL